MIDLLIEHGAMLLVATTSLLAAGAVAVHLQKSPIHRQKTAEVTIAACLLWLLLAAMPLPRMLRQMAWSSGARPSSSKQAEPPPAESTPRSMVAETLLGPPTAALADIDQNTGETEQGPPVTTAAARSQAPVKRAENHWLRQWSLGKTLVWCYLFGVGCCCGWIILGRLLLTG